MIRRNTYAGIFVLSFSLLLFELTLIRVYSATLFYHFAFMAISVAMLGLAAAGLTVHLCPKRFTTENADIWGMKWSAAFAVTIFISMWVVFWIPVNAYLSPDMIAGKLIAIYLLSALPFYFAGLVFTGLFSAFPERAGTLYAWDLIGAGLGAVAILPMMNLAGGEAAIIFIAMLGFIAASLLAGKRWKIVAGLAVLTLIMSFTNPSIGWIRILYTKGQSVRDLDVRYNRWNSFSRIMVIPFKPGTDAVYTWCPSPNYELPVMEHLSMMIDDGAATPILPFDGNDLTPINYLKYDLTSLCHRMKGDGQTLIIGSGGGRDVLTGLLYDAEHIDAVDINPLVFDAMNGPIAEFSGDLYRHPRVSWFAEEGRAFARRHPNTYDLVQIAMIDTWAATTAGAYSLSENTLYTVEAFQDYIHALKPGGIFSFTRFYLKPPRQALRLISLFLETAKIEGIRSPDKCILVGMYGSLASILFKTEPFTQEEIAKFKHDLNDLGFYLVYAPDERPEPFFRNLVEMQDKSRFYRKYPIDISPPFDNKPFFFNMLKIKDIMKVFDMREGQKFNYYATYTLILILIISIITTITVLILPTIIKSGTTIHFHGRSRLLFYFIGIGLAYIMIEVTLLQRFVLLLEHPAYAASGVVAGLLISSGIGSMIWGKTPVSTRQRTLIIAFIVIGCGLAIHIFLGWIIIHKTIHLPMFVKSLIAIVLIIPMGIAMGMPLPAGITVAGGKSSSTVAWCWALNGAASVVASSLAVTLAMSNGFVVVLVVSLVCYMMSFFLMRRFAFNDIGSL